MRNQQHHPGRKVTGEEFPPVVSYAKSDGINVDRNEIGKAQFGGELYRLREIAHLRQSVVAKKSGVSRGYYSQLENSRKPPPPRRTVSRIADALALTQPQRCRLECLAAIEREKESSISLCMPEGLEFVFQSLTLKASSLSTHQIRRIFEILEEASNV
ncbi:helix-turn-helix transcriptional regulator [Herbaspirillum sp.]|uniref:helix-turn-helix domain-containing protein n=1 Tax=Herbaspirillum sp. TaxID=1890675 RepID=UPI0031E248DB